MVETLIMKNILSCMFALTSEQVTLLRHYAFNEEGNLLLANIDMSSRVVTRKNGSINIRFESLDFAEDKLTKNIILNTHIIDEIGLEEMLAQENSFFKVTMRKSVRTNKLIINVVYDGYNE